MSKQELTIAAFIMKAANAPENCPIEILSLTIPKMNKSGKNDQGEKIANPYLDRVKKQSLMKCTIKYSYTNDVNTQRLNEGKQADFVAKPRQWGDKDGCIVSKPDGQLYIDVRVDKTVSSIYILDNKEPIKKELLTPFMSPESESKRQETFNQTIVRTIKLENIKEVKIGDTEYFLG